VEEVEDSEVVEGRVKDVEEILRKGLASLLLLCSLS
jgi:hypothetical protein